MGKRAALGREQGVLGMIKIWKTACALVAGVMLVGGAYADDTALLRNELLDMKAKVASMEATQSCSSCTSGCSSCEGNGADSLTSMHNNAQIQIGGAVQVDTIYLERTSPTNQNNDITTTRFSVPNDAFTATHSHLDFKVSPNQNSYVFISFDLGEWDANPTAGRDLIDAAYFAWEGLLCDKLDVRFGQANVNYGMDKSIGATASLHDGGAYYATGQFDGAGTLHSGVALPTGPTEVYLVGVNYHFSEDLSLSWDLFQNVTTVGASKSDDDLLLKSWATKLEYSPAESLVLQASFLRQYDDSRQNPAGPNTGSPTDNQTSISLGAQWSSCDGMWDVWGEYQHGWDWGYNNATDADVFGIGVQHHLTENMAVAALFEVAKLDSVNSTITQEDYWQVVVTGTYTLDSGIYMQLEYAHQDYESDRTTGDTGSKADSIGFRTGIVF
jgi:hypothetical protein